MFKKLIPSGWISVTPDSSRPHTTTDGSDGPSHPSESPANSLFSVRHLWPAAQPPGKPKRIDPKRCKQYQWSPMVQSISKCFKNSCPRARGHFLHNCCNSASQDHCSLSQIELLQAACPIFINFSVIFCILSFCREKAISAFRLVLKGITLRSVQFRPWFGCSRCPLNSTWFIMFIMFISCEAAAVHSVEQRPPRHGHLCAELSSKLLNSPKSVWDQLCSCLAT